MDEAQKNAEVFLIEQSLIAMRDRHNREFDALLCRLERLKPKDRPKQRQTRNWKQVTDTWQAPTG